MPPNKTPRRAVVGGVKLGAVSAMKLSHYEVLGVEKNCTAREVKMAYYARMREVHPDAIRKEEGSTPSDGPGSSEEVMEAYQVLKDHKARIRYDRKVLWEGIVENLGGKVERSVRVSGGMRERGGYYLPCTLSLGCLVASGAGQTTQWVGGHIHTMHMYGA